MFAGKVQVVREQHRMSLDTTPAKSRVRRGRAATKPPACARGKSAKSSVC
ncbi:hypothetical protein JAN5088_01847 [Jannaschia rubra]|uniref:Uncharacterized protein n=1 Tax=Jannaschia rubra TaxID=282197 RepID=A0A0M6XSA7_9RHOB|nr:hypothetical protein JAN5088_01847 [Jannaschia rubra]SFG74710.1 hypothetical protein SAMN04488517_11354 [Jannaschia rubra]